MHPVQTHKGSRYRPRLFRVHLVFMHFADHVTEREWHFANECHYYLSFFPRAVWKLPSSKEWRFWRSVFCADRSLVGKIPARFSLSIFSAFYSAIYSCNRCAGMTWPITNSVFWTRSISIIEKPIQLIYCDAGNATESTDTSNWPWCEGGYRIWLFRYITRAISLEDVAAVVVVNSVLIGFFRDSSANSYSHEIGFCLGKRSSSTKSCLLANCVN